MSGDPAPADLAAERVATTPPVGVSSRQIFAVACALLAVYAAYGAVLMFGGGDRSERAAFGQSAINLAMLAAGFYLGSSAGSRNREQRS